MDLNPLLSDLKKEEGFRSYLYDDSNGKPLSRGSVIVGNPTIGYGWSVSTEPVTEELAEYILSYQVQDAYSELLKAAPWVSEQPQEIQQALTDMAFNLGVVGLLKFNIFLSLIKSGSYSEAADDLKGTLWASQVKSRATRIEGLIRAQQV